MQIPVTSIEFVPAVASELRQEVEALFYFNPRQQLVREGIRLSVEQFGRPAILGWGGRIWLGLPSGEMQCLFVLDRSSEPDKLVGVALYMRNNPEVLCITHLAIHPDYASGGAWGGDGVGLLLIEKVRQIARRISGINRIELPYKRRCFLQVSGPRLAEGVT